MTQLKTILDELPDEHLLAALLWAEIRGGNVLERAACGLVVRNRIARPRWWGTTWRTVILKNNGKGIYQFSCFNDGDPNALKLQALLLKGPVLEIKELAPFLWLARGIITGTWDKDITNGATHYITHAAYAATPLSHWARRLPKVHQDSKHMFFVEL